LHSRGINLESLTGICAGTHRPNATAIAEKMLFLVAVTAAEMERELIRERTLDGLASAAPPADTAGARSPSPAPPSPPRWPAASAGIRSARSPTTSASDAPPLPSPREA
jgi:DNA invertase Pin-like site-specific DNA recombinase